MTKAVCACENDRMCDKEKEAHHHIMQMTAIRDSASRTPETIIIPVLTGDRPDDVCAVALTIVIIVFVASITFRKQATLL